MNTNNKIVEDKLFAEKNEMWSNYTVLIVEDDIMQYKLLECMLHRTGIRIIHANNGVKGVVQVRMNPQIDLVLMDGTLPLMNGIDATRRILEINPALPVIAQTTFDRKMCLDAGFVDHLEKPVNRDILLETMSNYLPDKRQVKIPA